MRNSKIIDCITFFDNNFMFDVRYKILENYVDYFLICESTYDHAGRTKKPNFILKEAYDKKKIKYILLDKPFQDASDRWGNQAIQRDFILQNLSFASPEDYIFFSDPDEIVRPEILLNFNLKKKYGIFLQDCFNYKFNLFNKYESPWEGTRVAKKKDLSSIDFMRQKIRSKNLKYSFFRFDKERSIETFEKGGWHFNNLMSPEKISLKLKTFAHTEYASKEFSSIDVIMDKINRKVDLFNRGHNYQRRVLDNTFPEYLIKNIHLYKEWIV